MPFEWGRHDCIHFVAGAVQAMTGRALPLPGYASIDEARRLADCLDPLAVLDAAFPRCPHVPPAGSIVARAEPRQVLGLAFGVVVSHRAAFVTRDGLAFLTLRPSSDMYWTVPCAA